MADFYVAEYCKYILLYNFSCILSLPAMQVAPFFKFIMTRYTNAWRAPHSRSGAVFSRVSRAIKVLDFCFVKKQKHPSVRVAWEVDITMSIVRTYSDDSATCFASNDTHFWNRSVNKTTQKNSSRWLSSKENRNMIQAAGNESASSVTRALTTFWQPCDWQTLQIETVICHSLRRYGQRESERTKRFH